MSDDKPYELKQVGVRLKLSEQEPLYSSEKITSPREAIRIMADMLKHLDRENLCVVNIDGAGRPISFNVVSVGGINQTQVHVQNIFKSALLSNAAKVMVFHNHPSGDTHPSREDSIATLKMMMAADVLDIPVQDHVIVAGGTGEYYSYLEHMKGDFNPQGLQKLLELGEVKHVREQEPNYSTSKGDENERDRNQIEAFRERTAELFHPIGDITPEKIEATISEEAENIIYLNDLVAKIEETVIIGSRSRGIEWEGDGIDIAVAYKGNESENVLYKLLNRERYAIKNIPVNMIPINTEKNMSLSEYLTKEEELLSQKMKEYADKQAEYKPLAKAEELEEQNYNMIDNIPNNTMPRAEKEREEAAKKELQQPKRISVRQLLKENRAKVEAGRKKKAPEIKRNQTKQQEIV